MLGSSPLASSLTLLLVASALGCGLRSDPFAPDVPLSSGGDVDDDDDDPGDPNRPGTCNAPLTLPFMPTRIEGELSGPSFQEGWCGADGGPEDVYTLVPDVDANVTITLVRADSGLSPTLRVIEDGCEVGEGFTRVCTNGISDGPYHFLAQVGRVYSVIIDSRDGGEGAYTFNVSYDWPPLDQCGVHPEVIEQIPGSAFLWNNEFSQGQGRVDSYCGGPGRENMFRLRATYPGNAFARVESSGGFAPLISFRQDCAATSEIDCTAAAAGGTAELAFFLAEPRDYYLVVDQADIGAGGYQLRVDFE